MPKVSVFIKLDVDDLEVVVFLVRQNVEGDDQHLIQAVFLSRGVSSHLFFPSSIFNFVTKYAVVEKS